MTLSLNWCCRTVLAVGFQPQDEWLLLRQWFAARRKTRLTFRAWGKEVEQYLQLALSSHGEIQPLPAVILLNFKEHNLQELEFLRWARRQHQLQDALVIACSDQGFDGDVGSALGVGADFSVSKANEFCEVLQLLHRVEAFWSDHPDARSDAA